MSDKSDFFICMFYMSHIFFTAVNKNNENTKEKLQKKIL